MERLNQGYGLHKFESNGTYQASHYKFMADKWMEMWRNKEKYISPSDENGDELIKMRFNCMICHKKVPSKQWIYSKNRCKHCDSLSRKQRDKLRLRKG